MEGVYFPKLKYDRGLGVPELIASSFGELVAVVPRFANTNRVVCFWRLGAVPGNSA